MFAGFGPSTSRQSAYGSQVQGGLTSTAVQQHLRIAGPKNRRGSGQLLVL